MYKILTFTIQLLGVIADNASANDKQIRELASLDNSFDEEHHAHCFNHTLQLSAKTLLKPFNPVLSKWSEDDDDSEMPSLEEVDLDDDDEINDDDDANGIEGDVEDSDDEIDKLDEVDHEELLAKTAGVRETVTKV